VKHHLKDLKDLNAREICVLVPLIVLALWMGIYPKHFLDWSEASVEHLVKNQSHYQLVVGAEE
jgi:NADH-quinone oxidoreductase subunit M